MRFMLPESAKNYFSNIMRREGSHTSDEKNKFIQFDIYYCCALI